MAPTSTLGATAHDVNHTLMFRGFAALPVVKPVVFLLVVLAAVDLVLFFRISVVMGKFVVVWTSVIYPITYAAANAPIVAWKWYSGQIAKDTTTYPLSRLAIMAALDQTYQLLSAWPIPVLGGAVANVLSLLALPINMTLAAFFLRRRYSWTHYMGAALCIGASLAQVLPFWFSKNDVDSTGSAHSTAYYVMWLAVMIFSAFPNASSNVFKEAELKALLTLDVWYMNFVIGVFQALFGLFALPLLGLSFSPAHVPSKELPGFILAGLNCALGYDDSASDFCSRDIVPAAAIIAAFLIVNVLFSSVSLMVFRDESSAVYGVATAASLGLVSLLLLFPVVAGPATLEPSHIDAGAAGLAVAGALLYQCRPELSENSEANDSSGLSTPDG